MLNKYEIEEFEEAKKEYEKKYNNGLPLNSVYAFLQDPPMKVAWAILIIVFIIVTRISGFIIALGISPWITLIIYELIKNFSPDGGRSKTIYEFNVRKKQYDRIFELDKKIKRLQKQNQKLRKELNELKK